MKNTYFIIQKELKIYFTSAIAYVLGAFFLAISGYFFSLIVFYSKSTDFQPIFSNMAVLLIFILPLMSMRLIAEEKKSGTLEILLTRPIKEWQIILGKFFSSLVLFMIILSFTLFYVLIVAKFGQPELMVLLSGYLGIILISAAILAVGIFASTLTNNQIIAAVVTFVIVLITWLLSSASSMSGGNENILSYLALSNHLDDFTRGVISIKNIIYYLSFIIFWLYLSIRLLEARRWKWKNLSNY